MDNIEYGKRYCVQFKDYSSSFVMVNALAIGFDRSAKRENFLFKDSDGVIYSGYATPSGISKTEDGFLEILLKRFAEITGLEKRQYAEKLLDKFS